jgi:prevent-host-death family protein
MRTVGIRELKARLSEYLRAVTAGEEVLITDRGRVVARLAPAADPEVYRGLYDLVSRGVVTPAVRENSPDLYPTLTPILPDGLSLDLLDEERGDR